MAKHTKTGKNMSTDHKMYQMAIKYTKWLSNIPNGRNLYHHFIFHGPKKYSKTGIFGLKIYHPATLCLSLIRMTIPKDETDTYRKFIFF
jgi:hypothetical protein